MAWHGIAAYLTLPYLPGAYFTHWCKTPGLVSVWYQLGGLTNCLGSARSPFSFFNALPLHAQLAVIMTGRDSLGWVHLFFIFSFPFSSLQFLLAYSAAACTAWTKL
jgi:hypothetical protein